MQELITISLDGVNCYLLKNEGKYALVDTGGHMFMDKQYSDRCSQLKDSLTSNGVNESNLEIIILTHGDCDHVFNAACINKTYNAKIAMHPDDVWMVSMPQTDSYKINSNYESKVMSMAFKMVNKKIEKLMSKVYSEFEPFTPDILLTEGCLLKKYGFDGTIYNTPGHTKGSICILDSKGRLICGDLFSNNNKPSIAINAEDFSILKKEARRMLNTGATRIYPGHGSYIDTVNFSI